MLYKRIFACLLSVIIFSASSVYAADTQPIKKIKISSHKKCACVTPVATPPVAVKKCAPARQTMKFIPEYSVPILPHVNIDGNIRMYYFQRKFGKATQPNQTSFSLGGKLNLLTDAFWNGFRLGATYYTAQPLGMNPSPPRQDKTLPGTSLSVLGQAFGQYQNPCMLIRVGDQIITSPWLNEADSRMIPATYQAIYANFIPFQRVKDLSFTVMRQLRYKGRISNTFTRTNLYNVQNGGATPIAGVGNDNGTFAAGIQYKTDVLSAQAWGYEFYDFASLFYGDFTLRIPTTSIIKPIIGAQAATQEGVGNNVIRTLKLGAVHATVVGAMLGVEIANLQLCIGYDNIPKRTGNYLNGDIVSPYTSGLTSDPLYTSSMISGLIEKAAGYAGKITADYLAFDRQLRLRATYSKCYTQPFLGNSSEINFDVAYIPVPCFNRSLSIRERVGILNGVKSNGRFLYTRFMVEYDFA